MFFMDIFRRTAPKQDICNKSRRHRGCTTGPLKAKNDFMKKLIMTLALMILSLPVAAFAQQELEQCDDGCDDPGYMDIVTVTRLGKLGVNMEDYEVRELIGEPEVTGEEYEYERAGTKVVDWIYTKLGVELQMERGMPGAPWRVRGITAQIPCKLRLDNGIGIGTAFDTVKASYGPLLDSEISRPPSSLVAGSKYGGILFWFEDGLVEEIYIGPTEVPEAK